jgi:hypothetical protein
MQLVLRAAAAYWILLFLPPVVEGARVSADSRVPLPPEPWDNAVWTDWIAALEHATKRTGETLLAPLRLALASSPTSCR